MEVQITIFVSDEHVEPILLALQTRISTHDMAMVGVGKVPRHRTRYADTRPEISRVRFRMGMKPEISRVRFRGGMGVVEPLL